MAKENKTRNNSSHGVVLLLLCSCLIGGNQESNVDGFTLPTSTVRPSSSSSSHGVSSSLLLKSQISDNSNNNSVLVMGLSDAKSQNMTDQNAMFAEPTVDAAQFGQVVPLRKPKSHSEKNDNNDNNNAAAQFGQVVSLRRPVEGDATTSPSDDMTMAIEQRKRRGGIVAVLSIGLAVLNYVWQYLHPLPVMQVLYTMEQQSSPITVIGTTSKPTVVDFWAPWCENCKALAPTLLQLEKQYSNEVNFVMINGDDPKAWPLIEAFGVDAIPHLAMVEADGTVDTALIGLISKQYVEKDLQVLIANAKNMATTTSTMTSQQQQPTLSSSSTDSIITTTAIASSNDMSSSSSLSSSPTTTQQPQQPSRQPLPYQMLDVFANRPEERRIQIILPEKGQ